MCFAINQSLKMETDDLKGLKFDEGKPMAGLLIDFGPALIAVAQAGTYGAVKYGATNWKQVPEGEQRYRDAGMRHRLQHGNDEESGLPHLYHAAWNILAELTLHLQSQQTQQWSK